MTFGHDTEVSLGSAAALVNTDSTDGDTLTTVEQLDEFVRANEFTGSRTHDAAELRAVRRLRTRLRELWRGDDVDALVDQVNQLLREGRAMPQLVRHDRWDYHLHATAPEQPLGTRMAVEAAMALTDLVRSGESERLRSCAADDCDDVLIDLSKNRSKRFCSLTCGNRANMAAYRARRSAGSD